MTDTPVYFNNAEQVIPLTSEYRNAAGALTDPSAIILVVTDPHGTATTYTFTNPGTDPNQIVKDSTGEYHIDLMPFSGMTPPPSGLWTFVWTGAGGSVANGAQVEAGTFRVVPYGDLGLGMTRWYCSKEELKSRLQIDATDTGDDYEIQLAIQATSDWITRYCGRHFYRVTETRTFRPENVWQLFIDDLVTCTSVDLDYDGDGVYEVHWTEGIQYQLLRYNASYNVNDLGVAQPRNDLQVIYGTPANPVGGQWLPWIWPFTQQNRVSITAVWGWPDVPPGVTQAALLMAADMFKMKDAPWGVAGVGELGLVKTQSNPMVVELLRPYINVRKKVGV